MQRRCQRCHQQEYAQWQAGPHAATYAKLFLNEEHNRKQPPIDYCMHCHGMHFEGNIGELTRAMKTALAQSPAMPCLACHAMHREGEPMAPGKKEIFRPSLGLFDNRARENMRAGVLAMPVMVEGTRAVKMSPDPRQALCYQCHAPTWSMKVASGDDRTPIGVHEGLSCLACHQKHGQSASASCAECHPRLSNCGLDVEKMDTTFLNVKSKHNIHWVKCADCHTKGVPARKRPIAGQGLARASGGNQVRGE